MSNYITGRNDVQDQDFAAAADMEKGAS